MPRIQSPLLGGAYQARTRLLNAQRAINVFASLVESKDGKEVGALYPTPGMQLALENSEGPWRGFCTMGNGALYGVRHNVFQQITGNYSLVDLGHVTTSRGPVGIVDSGLQILIVDGDAAWGYDIGANRFEKIDLPLASGHPVVCAYQDGFFLINQSGTQIWWRSDSFDVFTWNGINFAPKASQPDPIVTMIDNHREVWLLGSHTTEVWINGGSPGFSFEPLQGVFMQQGCAAPYSVAVAGASVIWLSSSKEGEGMVLQSRGYQTERVSTHAIERAIQSYEFINDAIAFVHEMEGHLWYVLTFPRADATWVFDATTGLWHEWLSFDNGSFHRHRSNCHGMLNGAHVVGDFENGNLYVLDLDTYHDAGRTRKCLRAWPAQATGQITLNNDRHDRLQIYLEAGTAPAAVDEVRALNDTTFVRFLKETNKVRVLSGPPPESKEDWVNPQIMLRWSDSGGRSFGNEHWRPLGKIGEIKRRVMWQRLGTSRDRVYELSWTSPVKVALVGAFLDVSPGVS